MLRIAHISLDEKFIDCAINQFNSLQNTHSTFCVKADGYTLSHIKNSSVKIFTHETDLIDFINNNNFKFVILHSLCISPYYLLKLTPQILWCSWGYDIYSDKSSAVEKIFPLNLLKPLTRAASFSRPSIKNRFIPYLRKIGIRSTSQKRYDDFVKKVSYFSVVLPDEFDEAKKKFSHLKFFPFRYIYPKSNAEFKVSNGHCNSILLGNSLDPNNNHIDLLSILENKRIKCTAYIPISYPNNQEKYKEHLKSFVQKLQFVSVRFLENFIPREEYFKIIDECNIAIFGHIRQQATGNIFHMFYGGKKVFFFQDSLNYKYLKKMGFKIFSIENDLSTDVISTNLNEKFQKNNFHLAQKFEEYNQYLFQLQSFFNNLM